MEPQMQQQYPEPVEPKSSKVTGKRIALGLLAAVLLAAVCFGIWYWQQQEIDDLNNRIEQLEQSQVNSEENRDNDEGTKEAATIPEDWTEYRNERLGFSFAYPEEWGEVQVEEDGRSYEGQHYRLSFSDYDQFKLAAKSTDYRYTGPGMGAPPVDGFDDFDEKYENAMKFGQDLEGYNGEIHEKNNSSVVYSHFDLVGGNVIVKGIAKLDKLAGMEFAYLKPINEEYFTDAELAELRDHDVSNSPSDYMEEDEIELVQIFTDYVKPL